MEQGNNQNEFVDLSQVLSEAETQDAYEDQSAEKEDVAAGLTGMYKLVSKLSGGAIKTEKQVNLIFVVLIILMNIVTFSLLFKGNNAAQPVDDMNMEMPAQAE